MRPRYSRPPGPRGNALARLLRGRANLFRDVQRGIEMAGFDTALISLETIGLECTAAPVGVNATTLEITARSLRPPGC
jgi:hypothetical protein